jgi:hypothetical protein
MKPKKTHKISIAALTLLACINTQAEQIKCPNGYQPYSNRCISQRMADYISCVEVSGGNHQEISEEVSKADGDKKSGSLTATGKLATVQGQAGITLSKATENAIAKKLNQKWFSNSMQECTKVLNSSSSTQAPPAPSTPKPVPAKKMSGSIFFRSETGDYIGDGMEISFSESNSVIESQTFSDHVSISIQSDDNWSIDFSAPRGQALKVGSYPSAQRFPFNNPTKPGIDVSGAGRGCNKLSGSFEITDILFSKRKTLEKISATFVQHCEDAPSALKGELVLTAKT